MRYSFATVVVYIAIILLTAGIIYAVDAVAFPGRAQGVEFAMKPKDRPVLETVRQVWQARTTGVAEFDFDGSHYVISGFPKEYVDYSSWYVRMP